MQGRTLCKCIDEVRQKAISCASDLLDCCRSEGSSILVCNQNSKVGEFFIVLRRKWEGPIAAYGTAGLRSKSVIAPDLRLGFPTLAYS